MEENTLVFIVMITIIVVVISIVQGWGQNQNVIDEHELFKNSLKVNMALLRLKYVTHGVQTPKTPYWFSLIRRR